MIKVSPYTFKQIYKVPEYVPLAYDFHMVPDFTPVGIPDSGVSGIEPLDAIHTSMFNMAKLLDDNRELQISPMVLLNFIEWTEATYLSHYALEEEMLKAFVPRDYSEHYREHMETPKLLMKSINLVKMSPYKAQIHVTDMFLNLITDHFMIQDYNLIHVWKDLVEDKKKTRFLRKLKLTDGGRKK